MTSRPSTAAPILAVLALVLVACLCGCTIPNYNVDPVRKAPPSDRP